MAPRSPKVAPAPFSDTLQSWAGEAMGVLAHCESFQVICAGDPVRHVAGDRGGAIRAARAHAGEGLRVALATTLDDTALGRALRDRVAADGVDVRAVRLRAAPTKVALSALEPHSGRAATPRFPGLNAAGESVEDTPFVVPDGWSSQVLLLSGVSPGVGHAAAFCRAARAARRAGSFVVLDVNARWHLWSGHDARTLRMVLREVDVVWCSAADLFGIKMDLASLRAAVRTSTVVAGTDGLGARWAKGPFGELEVHVAQDVGGCVARICGELARTGRDASAEDLWVRALG